MNLHAARDRVLRVLLALPLIGALGLGPAPEARGQAFVPPTIFQACYVPGSGVVYLIGQPGLKPSCQGRKHVAFDWTDGLPGHDHGALDGLSDDDHPEYIRENEAAGGDLTGSYPDPIVKGLRGNGVATTAPLDGQVLAWDAAAGEWGPATPAAGAGDHGALAGLGDDDHGQYVLVDGVRNATDGFAVTGLLGIGALPASGNGVRLLWFPGRAAFRAGLANGGSWDAAEIGIASAAVGRGTRASGEGSFASGVISTASGIGSTALGLSATASGSGATAAGNSSRATADNATALGGNTTAGGIGATATGLGTTAEARGSIAMGEGTTAGGTGATALGDNTTASGDRSTASGNRSVASGTGSTAIGNLSRATGTGSTALGEKTDAGGAGSTALGRLAKATGEAATAIGDGPTASGSSSTALGAATRASGLGSTALGRLTTASGDGSTALGQSTTASGAGSTASGLSTVASGGRSVALGARTTASGDQSVALGDRTTASGDNSTAMGRFADTDGRTGAFVYGDASTTGVVTAFADNSFSVRAAGGTRFYSDDGLLTGVTLNPGSGGWATLSDRDRKRDFREEDGEAVLAKVATMPIRSWSYKAQDPSIRHLGPTAQDFRAAFGLGSDDVTITTIDIDGVNMLAIQALETRTRELREEVAGLREENRALRDRVAIVETLLVELLERHP